MNPTKASTRTAIGIVLLAVATLACQSGLSSSAWAWCKQNLTAVDAAAASLGIPKVELTYQEPSWWNEFVTGNANASLAWVATSEPFLNACFAAAAKQGVIEDGRIPWCIEDGLGQAWSESIAQRSTVDLTGTTFAYKALPLQDRLTNPEFVRACQAASGSQAG